jgi:hypothetical protein
MLIALLAILGVDLIVIVVFVAAVLVRRRWVSRQAGAFLGVARVVDGHFDHLGSKSRRGYGRWVRDVLVWTPAPLFLRNALAPIDTVDGTRNPTGKVRRLGDNPRVITLTAEGAHVELTVCAEDVALVTAALSGSQLVPVSQAPPTDSDGPRPAA